MHGPEFPYKVQERIKDARKLKVDFHCRVISVRKRVNKTEAMYGRSRVNVKVEPRST